MTSKEALLADTRTLYRVHEAADKLSTTSKDIIIKASKIDAKLLCKIPDDMILSCSTPLFNHQSARFGDRDFSQFISKPLYKETNEFEYITIDHNQYLIIMATGELVIDKANSAAVLDKQTGDLILTTAPEFASNHKISRWTLGRSNSIFFLCTSEPEIFKKGIALRQHKSMLIKMSDLWISTDQLIKFMDDIPKTTKKVPPPLYDWMNTKLKILNRASSEFFDDYSLEGIRTSSEDRKKIAEFINKEHAKLFGEEISNTQLNFCVDAVRPDYRPRNTAYLSTKIIANRYPHYFSPILINMNELSRELNEEYQAKLSEYDMNPTATAPLPPTRDHAIDKIRQKKALPVRMIENLASFIQPN